MTPQLLEKLKKAYYSGVLEVREGDSWLRYQSASSMRRAIEDAENELSGGAPQGSRVVTVVSARR